MTSLEDKTFKLKWTMEDYSVCAGEWHNWDPWVVSDPFLVDALGCTQWRMHMCPRTNDGYINCVFQRDSQVEEHGDISFQISATILGKDGLVLRETERVINTLSPQNHINVDIHRTEKLPSEHLANDHLVICFEMRQIPPDTPADTCCYVWKDELRVLSDDMRKLLQSGYLSDIALKSSDGHLIPVHFCVIFTGWKELQDIMKARPRRPRVVVCPYVPGQILAAFVSYLYTGTIPATDVTIELFEFVVARFSNARVRFYTLPQEMSMRSITQKESVVFKWWYARDGAPFHCVLPFMAAAVGEILVDISTVGSYLDVRFSLTFVDECVQFHCTAVLVDRDGGLWKSAGHFFDFAFKSWHFPDFIPMSLFTDGSEGMHVEFELSVSTGPDWTFAESTSTEFHTGSREVNHLEMVATRLSHFFMEKSFLDLCDVELRTADGLFRGCKPVLGIRCEVLRKMFRDLPRRSCVRLKFEHWESYTLSFILEYLYTGWTKLGSVAEALKINGLAVRMSLHGLVRKCRQYSSAHVGKHLL